MLASIAQLPISFSDQKHRIFSWERCMDHSETPREKIYDRHRSYLAKLTSQLTPPVIPEQDAGQGPFNLLQRSGFTVSASGLHVLVQNCFLVVAERQVFEGRVTDFVFPVLNALLVDFFQLPGEAMIRLQVQRLVEVNS